MASCNCLQWWCWFAFFVYWYWASGSECDGTARSRAPVHWHHRKQPETAPHWHHRRKVKAQQFFTQQNPAWNAAHSDVADGSLKHSNFWLTPQKETGNFESEIAQHYNGMWEMLDERGCKATHALCVDILWGYT